MDRLENALYREDIAAAASCAAVDWAALDGARIAITGATGALGAFLTDLLRAKQADGLGIELLLLGRSAEKARERFSYLDETGVSFEELDVSKAGAAPKAAADVVVHLASTTHPRAYSAYPVGTITSNVVGLTNLCEYLAAAREAGDVSDPRLVFASTVEVYGENRGDVEAFTEDYLGYIDCNTLRAGYPESKRLGEALCCAYAEEKGLRFAIPRLTRLYGPTMTEGDSKAVSQFIRKAVGGEDIVLKSAGTQLYSYTYMADAATGLLACLTKGELGSAYNVCGGASDITLRDLAEHLAQIAGTKVVMELPDEAEAKGYSTATKAILDGEKIAALGWKPSHGVRDGMERTVRILSELAG